MQTMRETHPHDGSNSGTACQYEGSTDGLRAMDVGWNKAKYSIMPLYEIGRSTPYETFSVLVSEIFHNLFDLIGDQEQN